MTVTELPSLPGETGAGTRGIYDINNQGQVVGSSRREPVLWEEGRPTPLWIAPNSALEAEHINDRGDIVLQTFSQAYHGRDGRVTPLNPPDLHEDYDVDVVDLNESGQVLFTSSEALAAAVNRHGQVVAKVPDSFPLGLPSYGRGILWSGGRTTRLGLAPVDINDGGQIAGSVKVNGQTHAALWENGRVTDLGTLGGDSSEALAVNERGQVLGESQAADGTDHAFLWTSGRMVDLGRTGAALGINFALNDEGQAIGPQWTPSPVPGVRPVMWTVHDDGDPGPTEPPAQQCFTAVNRDHVEAGRATSWLVFTWAAGSGTYIGSTSQTTSLREAGPGRWEPVAGC